MDAREPAEAEASAAEAKPAEAAPRRTTGGLQPPHRRLGLLTRLGLAVIQPRHALAAAADRVHAGRSGSDLIAVILAAIAATQLHGLAIAVWLGAIDGNLGLRKAIQVLTGALTTSLGLLVIATATVFLFAGARRNLGRALDLACVAVLPVPFIELVATLALRLTGAEAAPLAVSWALSAIAFGWLVALVALAISVARARAGSIDSCRQQSKDGNHLAARVPLVGVPARRSPPRAVPARRVGRAIAVIAVAGIAAQAVWIMRNSDTVKPMSSGGEAPAFALPEIDSTGRLGPKFALASTRGKVTVLDFWATWCGPCLASMPRLEQLARSHPDVAVVAINLDSPSGARALFNQRGYTMKLLADDDEHDTSGRYGVSSIPHTVIIDQRGVVRRVVRGTGTDIAAVVEAIRTAP